MRRRFAPEAIPADVLPLVAAHSGSHFGDLQPFGWAVTLFLHRRIGGTYLLVVKVRARVALRPTVNGYCRSDIAPR